MKYFIAMDGGGTKLDAMLFNEDGHIIKRVLTKGTNAMDIGYDLAEERLIKALKALYAEIPDGQPVEAVYGGIAGAMPMGDYPLDAIKKSGIKYNHAGCDDDGAMIVTAVFGAKDACCIICGTGSSCFVKRKGKRLEKVGGKGYIVDTNGSGYDIGKECLRHAFRSIDGREGPTMLVDLVGEKMGAKADECFPNSDWMRKIYDAKTGGRPYIATFATCVFEAAEKGDKTALAIMDDQSTQLAELTWAAGKFFDGNFDIVLSGGIIQNVKPYAEMVRKKANPKANFVVSTEIPAYGAAVETQLMAGIEVTKEFHDTFAKDYKEVEGKWLEE